MIINENQNIWDLLLTSKGSISDIYDFLKEHSIESIQTDLTNQEIELTYLDNDYSQTNKIKQYVISTKNLIEFENLKRGAFNSGFDSGFDNE